MENYLKPRLLISVVFLSALTGCASPSLRFTGSEKRNVAIDGFSISVFSSQTEAQAIRTSRSSLAKKGLAEKALKKAIIEVTGCAELSAKDPSDWAILTVDLEC
ncbi:hypothetical protein ACOXXX_05750 [Thalassococcus sp. BH17M4-6]|uniref:hypothetical protein n=1 Tax=Thalassococcus sp. BH17M4-6 TaxID=3413148 RepID=UPI003BCFBF7F